MVAFFMITEHVDCHQKLERITGMLKVNLICLYVTFNGLRSHLDSISDISVLILIFVLFCRRSQMRETLLEMATSDIAQLCAENVIIWTQYLELVTSNDTINHILAKEHHTQRVGNIRSDQTLSQCNRCRWISTETYLMEGQAVIMYLLTLNFLYFRLKDFLKVSLRMSLVNKQYCHVTSQG